LPDRFFFTKCSVYFKRCTYTVHSFCRERVEHTRTCRMWSLIDRHIFHRSCTAHWRTVVLQQTTFSSLTQFNRPEYIPTRLSLGAYSGPRQTPPSTPYYIWLSLGQLFTYFVLYG